MADIRKLTDDLSVAPQISTDDVSSVGKTFKSILCNRPDQEDPDQPAYEEIKKLAEAQGITIKFQPVNGSAISDDDVDDVAQHIADLPKPVLAYCRSGTRCTVLWALSQAGKQSSDEILKTASIAGYSLDGLRPRIAEREQDS